jgi:nucleoside-diphosphate-sugar epimerase
MDPLMVNNGGKQEGSIRAGCVLVTGGTGALGPGLVRGLTDAGFSVRVFARDLPAPGALPESVELLIGDLADREVLRKGVEGVKLVFHLAALLHIPNPTPELHAEYWRVNVEGTRSVVEESLAAGVERLVYFSTISLYGPTVGPCADEDSSPHPISLYAKTKLAGEDVVRAARNPRTGEPLGVVLRMAPIYGPRMKGNYPRLVKALSGPLFIPVGKGDNRRTLVYEEDAVRAAVLAGQHPRALGQVYNVTDGEIHLLRDIIAVICQAIGRRPPRFFLPTQPARWLARGADGMVGLLGYSLNLTETIDKFVEDAAVRGERIQQELQFRPLYGLQQGWRQAVAAWQAGGLRVDTPGQ